MIAGPGGVLEGLEGWRERLGAAAEEAFALGGCGGG